jgi:thymidylate synthase (FAD)
MVKLIHCTPKAEKLLAYMARVSSPEQENPEYSKLLKYLITHKHWSPFEMVNLCVEIQTSRAIAQQILRHRSFSFQEFSQRYAKVDFDVDFYEARRQDEKNRQNSIEDLPDDTQDWFLGAQESVVSLAHKLYYEALDKGIAKESARFLLPLSTQTKIYMNGSLRSWVHYIDLRTDKSTQKEHREIAEDCKRIFIEQFPITSEALGWKLVDKY